MRRGIPDGMLYLWKMVLLKLVNFWLDILFLMEADLDPVAGLLTLASK
jgi:hypothetical protein